MVSGQRFRSMVASEIWSEMGSVLEIVLLKNSGGVSKVSKVCQVSKVSEVGEVSNGSKESR